MLYKMINSLASRRFWNQTPPVSHRLLLFACDQPVWYWRCCGQSSPFFESHTEVHYITCGLSALCFKTHTAKAVALPLVYPAPHHLPVVCPHRALFNENMYILAMKAGNLEVVSQKSCRLWSHEKESSGLYVMKCN